MSSKSQTSKTKSKDNDLYKNQLSTEDRLALKKMVSIDPNLGTVVVTAFPSELDTVEKYISTLQSLANKQVVIEAKILDVTLNKDHKEGLDLNLPNYKLKPNIFPETSSTGTFAFMGNGVMPEEISPFSLALNYISKQGDITILSSPRVSTMNNQKAVIKIGSDKYFAKSSSSTTSSTTSSTQTDSIDVTSIFSGVALDVTPEIAADNSVTLHIHPYISEVVSEKFTVSSVTEKSTNVFLPKVNVTESDTVVKAKDGEVIVIGGLMKQMSTEHDTRIPGLRHIHPNRENSYEKREMVILLKPTVVKTKTWNKALSEYQQSIR